MRLLQKLRSSERLIPPLLFLLVSSVYFMTVTGITSSNDGSHYAGARAFADYGRFDIAPFFSFVEGQDYSVDLRGAAHTDRPPGTGLIASAIYRVGTLMPEPPSQVPSKHDSDNPRVVFAGLTPALAGAATILLFYNLLRQHFEVAAAPALLAALALAFGTAQWKYSAVLYSHALAALDLFAILTVLLNAERRGGFTAPGAFLLGLLLGISLLLEYTNFMLVAAVLVYLAAKWGRAALHSTAPFGCAQEASHRRQWLATLGAAVLGGLLPLGFLLAYNTAFFGGPLQVSTFYVDTDLWPQNRNFAADFATPLPFGLRSLLLWGGNNQGLFLLSPVSLLAPFGLTALYRHQRRHFWLILGIFVTFLLLFSASTTFNPGTNDSRYLVPFLGMWFIPFGLWLDRTYFHIQNELWRALVSLLLFGLLFLSVRNAAAHIALSWGYDLNLAALEYQSISPYNLKVIGATLFPNTANLPLLWLLEGAAFAIGAVFVRASRALPSQWRPALDAAAIVAVVGFVAAPAASVADHLQPPGMVALDERLGGDLHLLGYQLVEWSATPQPGDPVRVRLYWQAEAPLEEDPEVRLTLVDGQGEIWGETRTTLGLATFRKIPATGWPVGQTVQEVYSVPLDAPPPYALETDLVLGIADQTRTLLPLRPATMTAGGPPEHPVSYDFAGLARLTGYDVEVLPYARLAVTLHWQVTDRADSAYTTFLHLVTEDGAIVSQQDAQPFGGRLPTSAWQPGDTLADRQVIDLGRSLRGGRYRLRVGLYNPDDGARVPVSDAEGRPVFDSAPFLGEVSLP